MGINNPFQVYILVFIGPNMDIELEDNKQFISNASYSQGAKVIPQCIFPLDFNVFLLNE